MTIQNYRVYALSCMLAAGLSFSAQVSAHAGEDHAEETSAPLPLEAFAPRAYAQSEDFELVVVLDVGQQPLRRLLATLDRFETNEPVSGATLEIEFNGTTQAAKEVGPGVYAVESMALAGLPPGSELALTVTVETPDNGDLLTTSLRIPGPSSTQGAHGRYWYEYVLWGSAVIAVFAALVFLLRRRRQMRSAR